MKKYRMRYSKGEQVKFIGHLDLLKVFERAAIRGGIPVVYSEGFNPHPDFVFGQPLAVGVTSECEYVDTALNEDWEPEALKEKFNEVMPDGIHIFECKIINDKTPNIMKSVKAAIYSLEVILSDNTDGKTSQKDLYKLLKDKFDEKQQIIVTKFSKSGDKQIDITPMFYDMKLKGDTGASCKILIEVSAGNNATLRPELAMQGLSAASGVKCEIEKIHRVGLI